MRKLPALVKLDNAEVKKEERTAASRLNFEQIFQENPSVIQAPAQSVSTSQQYGSAKQKRPSTPTVF